VLFDEDGWKRLQDEVPKMKLITPSALVERLKINGSLARAACKYLLEVRFFSSSSPFALIFPEQVNHLTSMRSKHISYVPFRSVFDRSTGGQDLQGGGSPRPADLYQSDRCLSSRMFIVRII
jgi:hypothetical protein